MEKRTLERMKELIRDFCYREYRDDKVDFDNLRHVKILYSTDGEFEEHDVNVDVDLIHLKFRYMYDGKVVHTIRADDEEDMCHMLEHLDFNDEYGIAVEWGRDEEEE